MMEMILLGICQRGKNMYKQGKTTKEAKTKKAQAHKHGRNYPHDNQPNQKHLQHKLVG